MTRVLAGVISHAIQIVQIIFVWIRNVTISLHACLVSHLDLGFRRPSDLSLPYGRHGYGTWRARYAPNVRWWSAIEGRRESGSYWRRKSAKADDLFVFAVFWCLF